MHIIYTLLDLYHVPDVLSPMCCHGCPTTVVLSRLSVVLVCMAAWPFISSGHPVLSFLSFPVPPWLSSPAVLSCWSVQTFLSQLFFTQLSCASILVPSSFVPPVLSWLHDLIVLSFLFCPGCSVKCSVGILSHTSCPACCPACCPVLAVQGCPHMADRNLKH